MPEPIALTWNEALSGVTGSISLASWIFLLLPQLYENYVNGNADGISLTFLFIWMIGDVTNLAGATWAGLVPTVIALAVYFCAADAVLIGQCLYYKSISKSRTAQGEQEPLLSRDAAADGDPRRKSRASLTDVTRENLGLPGSRRRSSAARRRTTSSSGVDHTVLQAVAEEPSGRRAWVKNTISILLIVLAGTAGWAIAWQSGAWRPTPLGLEGDDERGPLGAEILGYVSAVCYLGARIPQIVKNQRERSCDGLSLLFFMLSLLGNATYGAGILFHSVEKQYFLTNLPWLIGSLGTMAEDAIIFAQFHAFGEKVEGESAVEDV